MSARRTILSVWLMTRLAHRPMPGAEMWRVLGDEIVFIIPIKENKDFFVYTDKIFEILNIFVLKLKNGQFFDELEIDNDKKLLMKMQNVISLKAAAWIAITDGIQDQFDIAYSSLDIIRHDFVELILRYKILDFLLEDPFVGIKTEYLILSDKFDIALKDLLQRTVFLQETELYQKIIAFCGKWNKYNGYIGLKVQPSNNGQYVRMNQVLMEDYEEIEAIVQRMKSEICEIYESISQ